VEWIIKAIETIVAARVHIRDPGKPSRTFALVLAEKTPAREKCAPSAAFFTEAEQIRVEVLLQGRVVEAWSFAFQAARDTRMNNERSDQGLLRKLSLSLRTLMSFVRILPANDFFRAWTLDYRMRIVDVANGDVDAVALGPVSTASSPRGPPEDNLATSGSQDFVAITSSLGTLRLVVSYAQGLTAPSEAPLPPSGIKLDETYVGRGRASTVSSSNERQSERQSGRPHIWISKLTSKIKSRISDDFCEYLNPIKMTEI
jgi:hypothetical protein